MKKTGVLILAAAILAGVFLGACTPDANPAPGTGEETTSEHLSPPDNTPDPLFGIACNLSKSKYLNPITEYCEINEPLFSLLYDGLFKTGPAGLPEKNLVSEYAWEGSVLKLTLREGIKFHDGSALSAQDVVYSINLAKTAERSPYRSRLAPLLSAEAEGAMQLALTFDSPRGGAPALLDIPVIKRGTGQGSAAVGCGRYRRFSGDDADYLLPYEHWHGGGADNKMTHILMSNTPDTDYLVYGVISGNVDIVRINSMPDNGVGLRGDSDVYLARTGALVFAAFNARTGVFTSKALREAVSKLIDVQGLLRGALLSRVVASEGIFPPEFLGKTPDPSPADPEAADEALRALGYVMTGGKYVSSGGRTLSVKILVSDNEYRAKAAGEIAAGLKAAGIEAAVQRKSAEDFKSTLAAGEYDICVGEAVVAPDMDFSFLLGAGGNSFGTATAELDAALAAFRALELGSAAEAAGKINSLVAAQSIIVPIGFRADHVLINRGYGISGVKMTSGDIFYNITEWTRN